MSAFMESAIGSLAMSGPDYLKSKPFLHRIFEMTTTLYYPDQVESPSLPRFSRHGCHAHVEIRSMIPVARVTAS
jgi:hypothetical protein